jgi:hypothetical protein
MKYIFISYIPGAAGNFFSRCLNLLSNAYCYGKKNNLPVTIEEKLKMLSYESVLNRSLESGNWVAFEKKLTPYHEIITHHALPPDSYSLWVSHMRQNKMQLVGPDDQMFNFYIDPGNSFEWACMNALYKNSYLDVKWFIHGKKLSTDDTVYKIQLDNFLVDWDCFLLEFQKVTDIIGHSISDSEIQAVKILYNQWRTTILERNKIETFKKDIGFFM